MIDGGRPLPRHMPNRNVTAFRKAPDIHGRYTAAALRNARFRPIELPDHFPRIDSRPILGINRKQRAADRNSSSREAILFKSVPNGR